MRNTYPWSELVERGRRRPGAWLQPPLRNVPVTVVRTVRQRRHPALRVEDGHLEARAEHRYEDELGTQRCTVWLRFVASPPRVPTPLVGESGGSEPPRRSVAQPKTERTMEENIPVRKVEVSRSLAERGKEAGWRLRKPVAAILNEGLDAYVNDPAVRGEILRLEDVPSRETRVSVRVPDSLWDAATDRAGHDDESLASIVRRIIIRAAQSVDA